MKEHFCPAEQSIITYQGECSWCGEREALAQTREPVPPPWWPAVENILTEYGLQAIDFVADFKQALYTTPPQRTWVGLDEVEIVGCTCECIDVGEFNMSCAIDFARAIEAKLKERNTNGQA